jgi:hypothetical protein
VNVVNLAPTLADLTGPSSIEAGTAITLGAAFSDPGSADTFASAIDWGDGTTSNAAATSPLSATHTYSVAGTFTVRLTVSDDDGGVSNEGTHIVVVTAPPETATNGRAFGRGAFASPAGALVADPSATGVADFGFAVGFSRRSGKPIGLTGFDLAVGGLRFIARSVETLTITATTATFTGKATCDRDQHGYSFRVTVVDGGSGMHGAGDKIRIEVWRADTKQLVYDSAPGADANAAPTLPLSHGDIAIFTIAKP